MDYDGFITTYEFIESLKQKRKRKIDIRTSLNACINNRDLYPHYTDERFKNGAQTIFLAPGYNLVEEYNTKIVRNVFYVYSDRLIWFSEEKRTFAKEKAQAKHKFTNTAAYFQEYLRQLYDDSKLELVHILTGMNVSNGYPYMVYGFKSEKT